jgi:hypothetical protein
MNILLTESQYQILLENTANENFKPARFFDEKYGTNLARTYDFGSGMSSDDIWIVARKCFMEDQCHEIIELAKGLDDSIFPYKGVQNLDDDTKVDIIMGMASELNFDDIVYFAIKGVKHFMNTDVNRVLDKLPDEVNADINWVVSPLTLKKMMPLLTNYLNDF